MKKHTVLLGGIIAVALAASGTVLVRSQAVMTAANAALVAGRNVNMVAGTKLPWGDPWLQRQNEPSIAVSSRNPWHLFAGANDYRTIDMPDLANQKVPGLPVQIAAARDAWLGIFKSFDGGQSWITSLVPGYPQDNSADGTASPIHGYDTACDPCVRAGANGLFFMSGIAFNRSRTGGAVFVARFMDNNNLEKIQRDSYGRPSQDSIEYVDTKAVSAGNAGLFLDMPSLAVDIPRSGLGTSVVEGQTIPNARVYLAYTVFPGSTAKNVRSKLYLARSTNSGRTWLMPIKVSESQQIIQRAVIAIDPRDPTGKTIYIAYRRFLLDLIPDAIVVVKSVDGGATFTKPIVISTLQYPFDQLMNENRFRTNTYPTIAVDHNGIVYVAWAERRTQNGARSAAGQARIVMATSANGLTWNTPQVVELQDENGVLDGHQVMPALSYAGGRLMLVWYDQRGTLAKEVTPNAVTTYYEDSPGLYRQTVDVRAAEVGPGLSPVFYPSIQVSRYLFYLVLGDDGEPELENGFYKLVQAEYNPINYPMFQLGTRPFHGDFLDLASSPSILPPPVVNGTAWGLNTNGAVHPTSFHAAWTDNRDVRPPYPDWWGDWSNYYPPNSDQPPDSPFPQEFPCPGTNTTGMRNQNVYTASLSDGLQVGSPGNTKILNIEGGTPGGRRTFVVTLRDLKGEGSRSFTLSFDAAVPGHATASFMQNGDQATRGVTLGSYSSASVTVYVDEATSLNGLAPVKVDIRETPGDILGGYVVLNPDFTNLAVRHPDDPSDDLGDEKHTPRISDPKVWKYDMGGADPHPGAENPRVQNPRVHNSGLVNPRVMNSSQENPRVMNKTLTNENIVNSETGNPRVMNPRVMNTALTDMTWTVTNDGNTTSGFKFDAVSNTGTLDQYFSNGTLYGQVLVYKVHTTPMDKGCELKDEHHDELLINVTNPRVMNPRVMNVAPTMRTAAVVQSESTGDPEPDITENDATFWLAPGEEAYVILRVYDPDTTDGIDFDPQMVAAEVEAEAVDTGASSPNPVIVTQPSIPWISGARLPQIGYAARILVFRTIQGTNPNPQALTIYNAGDGPLHYTIVADQPWIQVADPIWTLNGGGQKGHAVSLNVSGFDPGQYSAILTVTDPMAANNPVRIPVSLTVYAPTPIPASVALTGPARAGGGFISEAFTLTVLDQFGNPITVPQNTHFSLTSDSPGPHRFYAAPNRKAQSVIAEVSVGQSTTQFYMEDSVPAAARSVTATWGNGGSDLGSASAGLAVWPVINQIAYNASGLPGYRVVTMQPDGSNPVDLVVGTGGIQFADISPDGTKIVYSRYVQVGATRTLEIFTVNADGSFPRRLTDNLLAETYVRWSPDGSKILFARSKTEADWTTNSPDWEIFVMNADGTGVTQLTDNQAYEGGASFSPDQSRIAFMTQRDGAPRIYVMNADGSGQAPLAPEAFYEFHPAWSPDGARIAMARSFQYPYLYVLDSDGTNPVRLTDDVALGYSPSWTNYPSWSPDGTRITFMASGSGVPVQIYTINADGSLLTQVTNTTNYKTCPSWGGSKIALPFQGSIWFINPDGTGLTRIAQNADLPSWSPDGTKVAFTRPAGGNRDIYIANADGTGEIDIVPGATDDSDARWSPDGARLVFTRNSGGNRDIYTIRGDGTDIRRLTTSTNADIGADWSPDGTKIAFSSGASGGPAAIVVMNADGSNPISITNNGALNVDPNWSPDGLRIVLASNVAGGLTKIFVMNSDGSGPWTQLTSGTSMDRAPVWSPNGRDILFLSDAAGLPELYLIPSDGSQSSPARLTDLGGPSGRASWRTRADLSHGSYEYAGQWGSSGSGDGQFQYPVGITADSAGFIYVVDRDNARVQKFTSSGVYSAKWGSGAAGDFEMVSPMGIAADPSGNINVTDNYLGSLKRFTAAGAFIQTFLPSDHPVGIAFDPSGNMYIPDNTFPFLFKYTYQGSRISQWSLSGGPLDAAADYYWRVFVLDGGFVKKFNASGTLVAQWGGPGAGPGQFSSPQGIAVDRLGNVYVADTGNNRIQKFNSDGAFVTAWGSQGTGDGQFSGPRRIAIDNSGYVYVTDTGNNRVQKFRPKSSS